MSWPIIFEVQARNKEDETSFYTHLIIRYVDILICSILSFILFLASLDHLNVSEKTTFSYWILMFKFIISQFVCTVHCTVQCSVQMYVQTQAVQSVVVPVSQFGFFITTVRVTRSVNQLSIFQQFQTFLLLAWKSTVCQMKELDVRI